MQAKDNFKRKKEEAIERSESGQGPIRYFDEDPRLRALLGSGGLASLVLLQAACDCWPQFGYRYLRFSTPSGCPLAARWPLRFPSAAK